MSKVKTVKNFPATFEQKNANSLEKPNILRSPSHFLIDWLRNNQ